MMSDMKNRLNRFVLTVKHNNLTDPKLRKYKSFPAAYGFLLETDVFFRECCSVEQNVKCYQCFIHVHYLSRLKAS